ncbi:MAG: hypothetical protein DCF15_21260 [Phormidesmis priestleyi]|uniref:NERD domain-containing protein n=1 Tax=Phormidesmis priestleyi TaxID=268141 RepID=A0A2W4WV67_9CYAN|nr:MAG: hypothetical protein DCF15_21260 [Phormidesmis priestleyi]
MSYQLSSIKETLQATVSSFGRLLLIGSAAFGIASYANFGHHKSYWNGTIERVQTVDFNMLSHMLPTKLSQALIAGDTQEIQRTLDSNYGLFGLVVTDCTSSQSDCSQNVQYMSDSKLPWRKLLSDDTLSTSAYDVLRDPPPMYPTGSYADSRDPIRNSTGLVNTGRIIGRVYYVRGVPPSFFAAYSKWISAWPASFGSDSGTNRYYSLTTGLFGIGGLSAWMFMEMGFAKRRKHIVQLSQQKERLALAQSALIEEAQDLRQQLQERLTENVQLIKEQSRNLVKLEAAQKKYQAQESGLRASLQILQERLNAQEQRREEEKQQQIDLQTAIDHQSRAAELLKREIADLKTQDLEGERSRQQTEEKMAGLRKEQETKQKLLDKNTTELNQVRLALSLTNEERDEGAKLAEILRQQIEESKLQQANASTEHQESQKLLRQIEGEKEEGQQHIKALETKLRDEKKQGDQLKAFVDGLSKSSLNLFEKKIVKELNTTTRVQSAAWSLLDQFDVSSRSRRTASMFTDCIVIGDSFIAIIEAKNYSGKIYAEGDTSNSVWLSLDHQKHSMEIASCWGNNPYKQVHTYVSGAMQLFRDNSSFLSKNIVKEIALYGVVVFPDNADLSALDTHLGAHYRITQLGDLVDVLHDLERQARQHPSRTKLSVADVENCLYGRKSLKPLRRSAA